MGIAKVLSRAQQGLTAPLVHVEVHLAPGLPGFSLVGLPAPVVRESRERVRAAIQNSGYEFPAGRITVNLAPVELAKEGGRYDLPIALSLLLASGQTRMGESAVFECYGELGLSGELKPIGGLFLAAVQASAAGHAMLLPALNLPEVRAAGAALVAGFQNLREVAEFLEHGRLQAVADAITQLPPISYIGSPESQYQPFNDVKGQWRAKRALGVAAAGGHSAILIGTPGSGKTMLASQFARLLPPLSRDEALEVASIRSVASGQFDASLWGQRPYRAPHHSASANAIVGGGPQLQPGEISLAHRGVLFLDELPEFDRRVLESLREPLESGAITLSRASCRRELPADFQLLAAMNPCPCGYQGDAGDRCKCSPGAVARYRSRISGPLLDRIDIRVEVARPSMIEMRGLDTPPTGPANAVCSTQQIAAAQLRQQQRAGCLNARLPVRRLAADCALGPAATLLLERSVVPLALTGRGLHRLLRISRTIADLAESEQIAAEHLAEAIQLRRAI
jgi:magnesium chelatase family protein